MGFSDRIMSPGGKVFGSDHALAFFAKAFDFVHRTHYGSRTGSGSHLQEYAIGKYWSSTSTIAIGDYSCADVVC